MSTADAATDRTTGSTTHSTAGDAGDQASRVSLPSWMVSVVAHVCLLFVFASGLKSCGGGTAGEPEGDYREVGIYVKSENATEDNPNEADNPNLADAPADAAADAPADVEQAPVPLNLPTQDAPPVIGAGAAPPSAVPNDLTDLPKANRVAGDPGGGGGKGRGSTGIFGLNDRAKTVVYVIDRSGSMIDFGAMAAAKAELRSSIESLDNSQRFQIVVYNQTAQIMKLKGEARPPLYVASEYNKLLAKDRFVNNIRADGGTSHMPALRQALSLRPEIIYFLTDADDDLDAGDLDQIRRLNRSGTRIHCIKFGEGPQLPGGGDERFLRILAAQSGGQYTYRDVVQFKRR